MEDRVATEKAAVQEQEQLDRHTAMDMLSRDVEVKAAISAKQSGHNKGSGQKGSGNERLGW